MRLFTRSQEELDAQKLIFQKECVVFVGAGISIPPGKNWIKIVKDITTHCNVPFDDGGLPEDEVDEYLRKVIDECIEKDEPRCTQACRELFPKHILSFRTAMALLLNLDFKAILTTNFDLWLRQLSRSEQYQCCTYPNLRLNEGLQKGIFYLHGHFDSDDPKASIRSLIFGEKSFREAYEESLLPGFLLDTLTFENILFVGFNPTEKYISGLLRKSISIRKNIALGSEIPKDKLPKQYILWPKQDSKSIDDQEFIKEQESEKSKISQVRSLDIEPIFYDREDDDYIGLDKLLSRWINEGPPENRPAPFKSGFDR